MKIKLTLVRPGNDAVDLSITAEPTSSVADIARELYNADPKRTGAPHANSEALTLRAHRPGDLSGSAGTRAIEPTVSLADSSLASGAVVSLAPIAELSRNAKNSASAAVIKVESGVDAGKQFPLPLGSSTLGRDSSNRVVLADPLVSKVHLRINVTDSAEVIDLGSANGTLVNSEQVDRATLAPTDIVTLGDTTLSIAVTAQAAGDEVAGTVYLNRSPRLDPQYPGRKFKAPEAPERQKPQKLPWLAMLAPLVMGVVLYLLTKNLLSVVFVALSPVLLLGTFIDNRIQTRRQWKQAKKDFEATIRSIETEIVAEHELERTGRLNEAPSVHEIVADGKGRGPLLWTRRPEHDAFLLARLGLGQMPSRVQIETPAERRGVDEHWQMIQSLALRTALVDGVPVSENLRRSGNLGVAGSRSLVSGVARNIVIQLVGLHSPSELVVAAVASKSSAETWDWLKWLPHVGSAHSPLVASPLAIGGQGTAALVSELDELIEKRIAPAPGDATATLPVIILIVEDDAPIERARLVKLAELGPQVGVHLIWIAPSLARLPAACRTFLELTPASGDAIAGFVHIGYAVQPVQCDSVDAETALAFARSVAALVDAGARTDDSSDLPRSVSLLHLIGTDVGQDSESVLERWQETNSVLTGPRASRSIGKSRPNLRAVFGQGSAEPFALDLRADGPHALVGGTTGSGKSEFLQAWVLGLATAHSPQRVSFLFVDYKGGSAFADCVQLPHTVGLVTDLSPHLVRRALTSLRAELQFREHLLNRKGYKDLIELERSGDPEVPPSLLIIVDEFAALVNEVPEFVDGVVDVAQRGRSLGLHLVLATQRPAGVIRDNLRANTNLRVALRMADEDDSSDVLGTPMAATFDPAIPGRAAAKTGPGRIRSFQSGYAGGWTSDVPEPSAVLVEELSFGIPVSWDPPKDFAAEAAKEAKAQGPTDIKRIVATVRKAAKEAAIPELRKPWLPVLASSYDYSKLPTRRTDDELVIGVVDDARRQSQPTVSYFPDRDGNVAVIGTGGSGKSTVLRTLAVASAVTVRGGPVHVYGLDFAGGGLQMLEALPHVGSIINGDDEERVARLLRWLRDLVDQRAVKYSEARAGNIVEYRKIANAPDEPRIMLLLDGMGAFREAYEASASSAWFSVFSQIATDGRQVGVHVVVTGDRSGAIPTSLSSSIQRRLVLRMASSDDYGMLNVAGDILNPLSSPGRGILDELETQIAVLGGDPNVAVQAREIERLAAAMVKAGVTSAPSIERLSDFVPLSTLPSTVDGRPTIGVADDSLAPIATDTTGSFLIAGPPGSGRTTALATIASAVAHSKPELERILISPRKSSLSGLPLWGSFADDPDAVRALVDKLLKQVTAAKAKPATFALFIENLTDFVDSEVESELETLIKGAIKLDNFVVAESETSTWSAAYSFGKPMKSGRRGIILQPDDGDEDMLKASFGRIRRGTYPPGRGFLVSGGRSRKLQLATTEEEVGDQ
ncbi:MAG: hypothetical protein JWP19_670 [Rhodoglobus sp.]|nr:hypothetical protein [Rhodoglobus sp.]